MNLFLYKVGYFFYSARNFKNIILFFAMCLVCSFSDAQEPNYTLLGDSLMLIGDGIPDERLDDKMAKYMQAVDLYEKEQNWTAVVSAYATVIAVYFDTRNYSLHGEYAKIAYDLALDKIEEISYEMDYAVYNYAVAMGVKGNFKEKLTLFKKSYAIAEAMNNKEGVAVISEAIAWTYKDLGDYEEAIVYLDNSFQVAADTFGPISHQAAKSLRQKGFCYKQLGKPQKALPFYWQSIKMLKSLSQIPYYQQTTWFAYQDVADIYLSEGEIDSSFYYINKALRLQEKISPLEAYRSYLGLGKIYTKTGAQQKALKAYKEAYRLSEEEYATGQKRHNVAKCLIALGKAFGEGGEHQKALTYFQEALTNVTFGFIPEDRFQNPAISSYAHKQVGLEALSQKALCLFQMYQQESSNVEYLKESYRTYQHITQVVRQLRYDYLADGSKHDLAKKIVPIYEAAIAVALELYEISNDEKCLEQAFLFSENNKSISLFESVKEDLAKGYAGLSDSLMTAERELNANLNFYQKLIKEEEQKGAEKESEKIEEYQKQLFEYRKEYQALTAYLEKKYPVYFAIKYETKDIDITALKATLSANNAVLVEYMIGVESAYVFFLSEEKLKVIKIKEKDQLEERVSQLRGLLSNEPNSDQFQSDYMMLTQLANDLYQQLLAEGIQSLVPSIDRLVLVPDDVLNYLPFEMLLQAPAGQERPDYSPSVLNYLMNEFNLGYQYSASLMLEQKPMSNPEYIKGNFIGFAPTFSGGFAKSRVCKEGELYSLQCNGKEVETISDLMNGRAFIADEAGLSGFNQHAPHYRILHLATHACVDDSNIGLNKIYLADGSLSQYELNNLQLEAELTVLSACNTGMGQLLKGEGMMSLTRSFMLAGSNSVLTSLWSVDDCATSDIMIHYYTCLKEGLPKDVALARAKAKYLEGADVNNKHPYYWGAFVQFGSVHPIMTQTNNNWLYLGMGLALLIAVLWKLFFQKRMME